jgi:isoleucyl-tRNA synthetase
MCADTPQMPETVDYKDTLNLPKTDFPMRAGLPKREPEWLARWQRIGVYDRLRDKAKTGNRAPFTLHDGPPYANGNLHIGHALNKILKDMVVRSQQMMGRDARYIPGWDCHGLPIEWKIEEAYRKKGRNKDAVDVIDFRQECRKFAETWVDVQREEFKRLGVTGTWDDPYLTMDFHAERVIAEEFQKLLMNGTLYQGSKPVMWSPVEKTALAEAEVEYHDRQTDAVWVKFPLKVRNRLIPFSDQGEPSPNTTEVERERVLFESTYVVIWTTTPWTIPQNRAICFGPGFPYQIYEVTEAPEGNWAKIGDRLLINANLAEATMEAANVSGWKVLRRVSADEMAQLYCLHPFNGIPDAKREWDFQVPLLPGDHVTQDAGTGFVHTAPAHGDDDYKIGLRYRLPMTYNILDDSSYRSDLPFFAGEYVIKPNGKPGNANKVVIEKLIEQGKLLARKRITISDAHSWRSKAPVIRLNRPQWFAAIDKPINDGQDTHGTTIRERALAEIDNVTWTPQTGRNRLHSMIAARPDWVLSRQRAWGVPLTCFAKKGALPSDPDFLLRDPTVNARILAAFEAEGADAWYKPDAKARFLGDDHDHDAYDQVFDILDVWFDSGSTHAFVLRDRPDGSADGIADLYLEGTDQHRGWFHSSMLQSCATKGHAPYRGVLTHGFTLDEKGMKMSKSIGNTIVPQQVVDQYGADILRLWVAQTDYTADQRIGPEILKGVADSYRRLRNTMRFLLGSLADVTPRDRVEPADMPELERWVLHRLVELDQTVRQGYAKYDFQGVFQALFNFATTDLSAFYFDIRKDVLYCDGDTPRRRAARTVLELLFERLTTWLAPVLTFTMEEVWLERHPGDDSSVHLQDMPETPADWRDDALAAKWVRIRQMRGYVTGELELYRREKRIGSSLDAAPIVTIGNQPGWPLLDYIYDDLMSIDFAEICITSGITIKKNAGGPEENSFGSTIFEFKHAEGQKCQRCWKILPDVGTHTHPGVCGRCDVALG